jgi:hypothetical protein
LPQLGSEERLLLESEIAEGLDEVEQLKQKLKDQLDICASLRIKLAKKRKGIAEHRGREREWREKVESLLIENEELRKEQREQRLKQQRNEIRENENMVKERKQTETNEAKVTGKEECKLAQTDGKRAEGKKEVSANAEKQEENQELCLAEEREPVMAKHQFPLHTTSAGAGAREEGEGRSEMGPAASGEKCAAQAVLTDQLKAGGEVRIQRREPAAKGKGEEDEEASSSLAGSGVTQKVFGLRMEAPNIPYDVFRFLAEEVHLAKIVRDPRLWDVALELTTEWRRRYSLWNTWSTPTASWDGIRSPMASGERRTRGRAASRQRSTATRPLRYRAIHFVTARWN